MLRASSEGISLGLRPSPVRTTGTPAARHHSNAWAMSLTPCSDVISSRWLPSPDTPLNPYRAAVSLNWMGSSFHGSAWGHHDRFASTSTYSRSEEHTSELQ